MRGTGPRGPPLYNRGWPHSIAGDAGAAVRSDPPPAGLLPGLLLVVAALLARAAFAALQGLGREAAAEIAIAVVFGLAALAAWRRERR